MEDGASIIIEAAWAINMAESKEASTTLCGTLAGAEVKSGMSYATDELVYNRPHNGMLTEENLTSGGNVAYFTGGSKGPGYLEAKQWLEAIIEDKEPLVKPEEAFVVTKILDAVYKSASENKEIKL